MDEHVLEMFEYTPHEVFLNDHISRETLSTFEIRMILMNGTNA